MRYLILILLLTGCNLELKYCSSHTDCTEVFDIGSKGERPSWDEL